ncbi:hypothetical protein [Tepidibacter aestuarii]|uniref:hypothetical protein n=1 Tax=Tepidibacter aestuarii TaxID=2925782 RepID=UPI0020BE0289|nr:hypothetical protein [Tepidibacter aestuarii]CAH2213486.1 protein of unknown function [Tepidibacter aestuarii]
MRKIRNNYASLKNHIFLYILVIDKRYKHNTSIYIQNSSQPKLLFFLAQIYKMYENILYYGKIYLETKGGELWKKSSV